MALIMTIAALVIIAVETVALVGALAALDRMRSDARRASALLRSALAEPKGGDK